MKRKIIASHTYGQKFTPEQEEEIRKSLEPLMQIMDNMLEEHYDKRMIFIREDGSSYEKIYTYKELVENILKDKDEEFYKKVFYLIKDNNLATKPSGL